MPFDKNRQDITTEIPSGIPYIIGNEAAERFSYYGMRAILVIFMTRYLMSASGQPDPMTEREAQGYFHLFVAAVYLMPAFGALLADYFWGKYRTIIGLSLVYCLGHLSLAVDDTRLGLTLGLGLIAVGAGGIKPCVSAHVGDQFGPGNLHLLGKVFGWFYFAINLGAFLAMLIIPWLLAHAGASTAFAAPGVLMGLATWIFWLERRRFVKIPAAGPQLINDLKDPAVWRALGRLAAIYALVAVFWALFEQIGSSWVLQAEKMDRLVGNVELLSSQIQALNPLFIMLLTPCFSYGVYPFLSRRIRLTALKKILFGLFLTVFAFAIPAVIQMRLDHGIQVHILWQLPAYLLMTAAEVMVSITCLEYSYTEAPKSAKSVVMAAYFLSVSLGNLFTSAINFLIEHADGGMKLSGAGYFWFFTGLMLATALLFVPLSRAAEKKDSAHRA
ncbi:POT family MFS transporter [Candidatus Methylomicrobium oryzae]|uniref:POT family MFS transporter n=1 Tax=Candidatus Methylomicrobium oryzae TaxID=2802053 RepID=UPI001920D9F2|nr:POT family MFS transporter [Methylomicrobium sp. RS1]MBL1262566.1 POT family MFS transporter [Methylomicrobium sp. RS1]